MFTYLYKYIRSSNKVHINQNRRVKMLLYCYEFINIASRFENISKSENIACFCIIILQAQLKHSFSEDNCIILAEF